MELAGVVGLDSTDRTHRQIGGKAAVGHTGGDDLLAQRHVRSKVDRRVDHPRPVKGANAVAHAGQALIADADAWMAARLALSCVL